MDARNAKERALKQTHTRPRVPVRRVQVRSTKKQVSSAGPVQTVTKNDRATRVSNKATKNSSKGKSPTLPKKSSTILSHTSTRQRAQSRKVNEHEYVTILPGLPSLRLREKLVLYRQWYQTRSAHHVSRVAFLFGYFFIFSGLFSAIFVSAQWAQLDRALLATISCSTFTSSSTECVSDASSSSTTPLQSPGTTFPAPFVEFFPLPLIEPNRDAEMKIRIKNYTEQQTMIRSYLQSNPILLTPLHVTDDGLHTFMLPISDLSPGEYMVSVKIMSLDKKTSSIFNGPTFFVPKPPTLVSSTTTPINPVSSTTTTDGTSASSSSPSAATTTEPIKTVPTTTTSSLPESDKEEVYESEKEEVAEDEDVTEEPLIKPTPIPTAETVPTIPSPSLTLALTPGVQAEQFRLSITSSSSFDRIEVYALARSSTVPLFLGVATKLREGWLYWLNTTTLPAGDYRIQARGVVNNKVLTTASVPLSIMPKTFEYRDLPTYETEREKVVTTTNESLGDTAKDVQTPLRDLPTLLPPLSTTTDPKIEAKLSEIIDTNQETLNDLLRRYATAYQSNDSTALRLAESALNEKVYTLLSRDVVNSEHEASLYEIEQGLRTKLDQVRDRIHAVQQLRRERTNQESSRDQDQDGVTDHDEYLLYGTDPNNPDTDGDGVTDGVEIMTGFDPLSATPEAVIQFNPPQEIEYIDDSLLGVRDVAPLLLYEEENTPPVVHSEISGYGLPNSFVTLYVFSDPVVVTVKTADDGSFSYTFTKELEDGEHTVYVALTDNKGEIVVRSTGFRFVKTAQAFTYVDEARDDVPPVTATEPTLVSAPFNLAAAMGVVSFGFILLILGHTIRQQRPLEAPSPDSP